MTPLVAAGLGFAGAVLAALVKWLLERRKSGADADSVVVAAAERVVSMLRGELDSMRVRASFSRAGISCATANIERRGEPFDNDFCTSRWRMKSLAAPSTSRSRRKLK